MKKMKNFLPENFSFVDKSIRQDILKGKDQKIVLSSSGNGLYGPAQRYIIEYISRENCLLQFTGYTPEGSLGNLLCEANQNDTVKIGSVIKTKRAEVFCTKEFSAHAKADELIELLKKFSNLKLVLVNGNPTLKVIVGK